MWWDGQKLIQFPDKADSDHPGWTIVDCSCCVGTQWNTGDECDICEGSGRYFRHEKSRVLAKWPGGPFIGREQRKGQTATEKGPGA